MVDRRLIEFARERRRDRTLAETLLWSRLRGRALGVRFRREDPFEKYIADFSCRIARLVVETDGLTHTDTARDARRDAWFAARGWTVLRFSDEEVINDLEGVIDAIWAAVHERVPDAVPRRPDDGGRLRPE